jgi:hypothetical protein
MMLFLKYVLELKGGVQRKLRYCRSKVVLIDGYWPHTVALDILF